MHTMNKVVHIIIAITLVVPHYTYAKEMSMITGFPDFHYSTSTQRSPAFIGASSTAQTPDAPSNPVESRLLTVNTVPAPTARDLLIADLVRQVRELMTVLNTLLAQRSK